MSDFPLPVGMTTSVPPAEHGLDWLPLTGLEVVEAEPFAQHRARPGA
jgi:hypothetical protein